MCGIFDDWDAEDFAFWGGYIETQIEGEKDRKQEFEPEDEVFDKVSDNDPKPAGI